MDRYTKRGATSRKLILSIAAAVLTACATLPPPKPVQDLSSIAGRWEGSGRTSAGRMFAITDMVVKEDGTFELTVPAAANPGPKFKGAVRVVGDKLRAYSDTSGRDSTWILLEGDGKRVLRMVNDDGSSTSEVRPAKSR